MYFDIETESCMAIASHLTLQQVALWPQVKKLIRERCEMFRSGRTAPPRWIRKALKEIDPLLEIRWDYIHQQWLIERFSRADRAYVTVLEWQDQLDLRVLHTLREGDMWRFPSPEAYLAHKRAKSAERRKQNEQAGNERVMAAVDSLTKQRAENFMEVERALQTGETVVCGGETERSLERMNESALKAQGA